jgi:hypothetical protein
LTQQQEFDNNMRRKKMYKKTVGLFVTAMIFAVLHNAAWAEFVAEQFAESFNTFRNASGVAYQPAVILRGSGPVYSVTDVSADIFNLNIDAYSPNRAGYVDPIRANDQFPIDVGQFTTLMGETGHYFADDLYFSSFALGALNTQPLYECVGQLSYDGGKTRTSDGKAINLGIVYLYTKYATGTLYGYNDSKAAKLNEAFRLLLNSNEITTEWTTNEFLNHLVTEPGSPSTWLTEYNLNTTYPSWVDNGYAVYVMNLTQIGDYGAVVSVGDMLYLVKRDGGTSDVPEPATLFAWSVLGLGLFGAARHRKKRMS